MPRMTKDIQTVLDEEVTRLTLLKLQRTNKNQKQLRANIQTAIDALEEAVALLEVEPNEPPF